MKTTKTVSEVRKNAVEYLKKWEEDAKRSTLVKLWAIDKFEELSKISSLSPLFDNYIYYGFRNSIVFNHDMSDDDFQMHVHDFEQLINSISLKDLKVLPKGITFVLTTYTKKSF